MPVPVSVAFAVWFEADHAISSPLGAFSAFDEVYLAKYLC